MNCIQCGKEIPRGKRLKTERYKTKYFCSQDCYALFIQAQETKNRSDPLNQLKFFIQESWPIELESTDWALFMRQIEGIKRDYQIDYNDMKLTLKYAILYCDVYPDVSLGIGLYQYFPQYISGAMKFKEDILRNRDISINLEDDIVTVVKNNQKDKRKYWKFNEEF